MAEITIAADAEYCHDDLGNTTRKAQLRCYHQQVPLLKLLPFSAIAIIGLLLVVNIGVWAVVGVVLRYHPALASTAVLSWTLGLRHAFDADHISAIDLMTRRLVASGQKPVTVGTFFSLGHSTIVIITSIVVASTAAAVEKRFDSFSRIGGIIGSTVSAVFLIVFGIMNVWILVKLCQALRAIINSPSDVEEPDFKIEGGGCMFHLLKKLFKLVDRYGLFFLSMALPILRYPSRLSSL